MMEKLSQFQICNNLHKVTSAHMKLNRISQFLYEITSLKSLMLYKKNITVYKSQCFQLKYI